MSTSEFSLADRRFRSGLANGKTQVRMLKRITPLLAPLAPVLMEMAKRVKLDKDDDGKLEIRIEPADIEALFDTAGPLALSISELKDADLDWLIDECCSLVSILDSDHWVPFWNRATRKTQYDDLDNGGIYIMLTIRVLRENLSPFFSGLRTGQLTART